MRIAHVSDTHFGCLREGFPAQVIAAVRAAAPHAVALTGDITQRARQSQFVDAAAFIDALPRPHCIVPGNHDVPLYTAAARVLAPLSGYRRFLAPLGAAHIEHADALLVPFDTTLGFTIDRGRLSRASLANGRALFGGSASPGRPASEVPLRIALLHHPPVIPDDVRATMQLMDAEHALTALAGLGVDVILSGHTHRPYIAIAEARIASGVSWQMLSITANTATSSRVRAHENSFYLIDATPLRVEIVEHVHSAREAAFVAATHIAFARHAPGQWRQVGTPHLPG